MGGFKQINEQLLEEEKYSVRHSAKIELIPDEKKLIGKPSTPIPEIDLSATDIMTNTVLKSFNQCHIQKSQFV